MGNCECMRRWEDKEKRTEWLPFLAKTEWSVLDLPSHCEQLGNWTEYVRKPLSGTGTQVNRIMTVDKRETHEVNITFMLAFCRMAASQPQCREVKPKKSKAVSLSWDLASWCDQNLLSKVLERRELHRGWGPRSIRGDSLQGLACGLGSMCAGKTSQGQAVELWLLRADWRCQRSWDAGRHWHGESAEYPGHFVEAPWGTLPRIRATIYI